MPTAIGAYAALAGVKTRIGKTDNNDDTVITNACSQVNGWMEARMGRAIAPIGSATYLLDGRDAVAGGRCMLIPIGVRAITQLQIAQQTGGTLVTIPPTDYFIRPSSMYRLPGWPGTEIWLSDLTTGSYPLFPTGFENVRPTMTCGWAATPDELVFEAEVLAVKVYQARKTGQADLVQNDEDGTTLITRLASADFKNLLKFYAVKELATI